MITPHCSALARISRKTVVSLSVCVTDNSHEWKLEVLFKETVMLKNIPQCSINTKIIMTSFWASHGITGMTVCRRTYPNCIQIFVYRTCYTCPILTKIKMTLQRLSWTRWRSCLRLQPQGYGFRSSMRSFHFSLNQSFRNHYGSELDLVSKRNECQRYLLGDKGGRCIRLTWPSSCANCLENLQPLNPWTPEP